MNQVSKDVRKSRAECNVTHYSGSNIVYSCNESYPRGTRLHCNEAQMERCLYRVWALRTKEEMLVV